MKVGRRIADRFVIGGLAGSGAMGAVYSAIDQQSGETVAVKIIRDGMQDAGERFEREAQILAKLRHPAIVRYIDHGVTSEQRSYLVMEWLEGEDLGQRLARGPLARDEAITLAGRVADGLAEAHAGQILHRDIKPTNVFLPNGKLEQAKLLDFGIARYTTAAQGLTQTGAVIGTPAYMSPEQAEGQSELNGGTDIFSLGSVLFECLAGAPPFSGGHVFAILAKVIFDATPHVRDAVPELDRGIDSLVARMMCKRPEERPTAHDLRRALTALSSDSGELEAPLPGDSPSSITGREQRLVSVVAARLVSPVQFDAGQMTAPTMLGIGHDATATDVNQATSPESPEAAVDEAARRYGAQVARLIDGSIVAVLEAADAATDLAVRSARLALELQTLLGAARIVVATGHVLMSGVLPVGEVIDRATALLSARSKSICIDSLTAGLLPRRFELGAEQNHAVLLGLLDTAGAARRLLGKTTTCVGRRRELSTLAALYEECVDEPMARAVILSGPPGIGKSRVAREFVRQLEATEECEVFIGRGDPVSADSALSILREALRKSLGFHDDDPPQARRRQIAARVDALMHGSGTDRVARFLGEIVGAEFSDADDVELRAARQDARLMGDQMKRAFEAWLGACCRQRPVVLLLEDLQWADKASISFIDSTLRRLSDQPLLVLAVARDSVDETFTALWANRPVDRVRIGPLRKRAASELVRETLGDIVEVDQKVVDELVTRAAGNAFYLEELIRSYADGGTLDAPETVLAMLQARIQKLPQASRRVLRGASLYGPAFWRSSIEAIMGDEDVDDVSAQLALLEQKEIIGVRPESRFAGEVEYTFLHSVMRDAAYGTLPDDDRQTGHRIAGEWLRDVGESDAIVLAEHFLRGHCNELAAAYFEQGAMLALEGSDFGTAIRHCRHATDAGAAGDVLVRVLLIAAESHRQRREYELESECADQCLRIADPGTSLWYRAMLEANLAAAFTGDHKRLSSLALRLRLVENPRDVEAHVGTLALYASNLYFVGQNTLAAELGDEMENRAHEIGDNPAVQTRIAGYRARRAILSGDIARYITAHTDIAKLLERVGRVRDVPERRCKVAYGLVLAGRYQAAHALLVDTRIAAKRHALENTIATAEQNLGLVELRLGNVAEAIDLLTRNAEQAAARTAPMHEGVARAYLAEALIAADLGDRAESEARIAVDLLDGNPAVAPMAWAVLASARRHAGHKAGALDAATTAVRRLEAAGSVEEGAELARLEYARALHDSGDTVAAYQQITAAAAALTHKSEQISDAELRSSFLLNVPVNAETLACARAWPSG